MRVRRFRRRLISLFAVVLTAVVGFLVVHDIKQANALADVSTDYITLSYSVSSDHYNDGAYGNYAEWTVAPGDRLPYQEGAAEYFTYRIYYKIENNPETYNTGDLQIVVNNPFKASDGYGIYRVASIMVGANGGSVTSHDWRLQNYSQGNSYGNNDLIIENDRVFEAGMNTEGTIDVVVGVTMQGITRAQPYNDTTHNEYVSVSKVTLNNTIESNEVTVKVARDFSHTWRKAGYALVITPRVITSYDGISGIDNPEDYYWVIYKYDRTTNLQTYQLDFCTEYDDFVTKTLIGVKNHEIKTEYGENTVVFGSNGSRLSPDENGTYTIPQDSGTATCNPHTTIVGYPKSYYNAENNNLIVINEAQVYGTYSTEDEESLLTWSGTGLNLSDYAFVYDGNNVAVKKAFLPARNSEYEFSTTEMRNGSAVAQFSNKYTVRNANSSYYVRFGDDVLFRVNGETAETERLADDEYRFKSITLPKTVTGGNDLYIPPNSGRPTLFVRRRGESGYSQYNNAWFRYLYGDDYKVTFSDSDNIVGWYFLIQTLDRSILDYEIKTEVQFMGDTWPESGTVYNFNFVKATYADGSTNDVGADSYAEGITRTDILPFDLETYQEYRQRSVASFKYALVPIEGMQHSEFLDIYNMSLQYNPNTDNFEGRLAVRDFLTDYLRGGETDWVNIAGRIKEEDKRKYLTFYLVMPKGVILDYSADEIEENFSPFECRTDNNNDSCNKVRYADTGVLYAPDNESFAALGRSGNVQVFRNFRNTGRYVVKFTYDFETALTTFNLSTSSGTASAGFGNYIIKYHITHDTYDELGANYTFYTVSDGNDVANSRCTNQNYCDTGIFFANDSALSDIDGDGVTDEYLYHADENIRLVYASSTVQDTQTTVKGDVDGVYLLEDAMSSLGGEYDYRLRIRSGENKIANVVLYDNLEQAFGDNEHWQGEFIGVDTSYAESQTDVNGNPIKVNVYWSNKIDAGDMDSDDSWAAYDDSVDKSSVKSLAFAFMEADGVTPAKMPNAINTYVLVKMRAPSENTPNYAYNSFRSRWQSTDSATGQVLSEISGLNSNTTTISLDNLFEIHVINKWIDNDNAFGVRPDSLDFTLTRGGMNDDAHHLDNMSNEDNFDFTGLHLYDKDAYNVELPEVAYYDTVVDYDPDTYTYTFTHTLKTFDINIVHVWEDYDNKFGLRPDDVSYNVTRNDTAYGSATGSKPEWQTGVTGLPLAFENEFAVADDVVIDNYTTSLISYDAATHTYTFKSVLDVVEVYVEHYWDDEDDKYGLRPETMTYSLIFDDDEIDSATTDIDGDGLVATFTDIPESVISRLGIADVDVPNYTTDQAVFNAETRTFVIVSHYRRTGDEPDDNPPSDDSDDPVTRDTIIGAVTIFVLSAFGIVVASISSKKQKA